MLNLNSFSFIQQQIVLIIRMRRITYIIYSDRSFTWSVRYIQSVEIAISFIHIRRQPNFSNMVLHNKTSFGLVYTVAYTGGCLCCAAHPLFFAPPLFSLPSEPLPCALMNSYFIINYQQQGQCLVRFFFSLVDSLFVELSCFILRIFGAN